MKNIVLLLTFTAFCATLISPPHSFAQTFIDGQMPDTFLAGHEWAVNSVAFSPDGKTLASGSSDDTIKLWDVATSALKATLEGHEEGVSSVAFSPDGKTLASGSYDYTIKLWDVATSALKATLEGREERVYSVAFSPDGKTLASGGQGHKLRLWDVATGTLTDILPEDSWTYIRDRIWNVAFSPDGKTLASGRRKDIHILDIDLRNKRSEAETAALLKAQILITGSGYSNSPLRSRNTNGLLSIYTYKNVIDLWDVPSGTLKATLEGHTDGIYSIGFSPDGTTLVSGSEDRTVRLWDVTRQPKDPKATLSDHGDGVYSVAFSPDGTRLASGSGDGSVRIWTARTPINVAAGVTIDDLVEVAENFGEVGDNEADINGDGIVNVIDLILVAVALEAAAAAPAAHAEGLSTLTAEEVAQWLIEAKQLQTDNPIYLRGIRVLEQLYKALIPTQTALLANYPNPFNPETWIPYQLAKAADVTVRIYTANGEIVRTIPLGNMPAGNYKSRSRAAYWDGKNEVGEPVASGLYFYTLTAGDFTATRKLLIRK